MSDFPRGWVLTEDAGGSAVSIVVPGIANVVRVLDSFELLVYTSGAAAVAVSATLSSSDGAFVNTLIGFAIVLATNSDRDSGDGLDLSASAGATLTIATNVAVTHSFMRIQGHDI